MLLNDSFRCSDATPRRTPSALGHKRSTQANPAIPWTFAFVVTATTSLVLSGLPFRGWWQGFFLELGVGLLIAAIVDVAILGALHGLIEGGREAPEIHQFLQATSRIENQLTKQANTYGASGKPGDTNSEAMTGQVTMPYAVHVGFIRSSLSGCRHSRGRT